MHDVSAILASFLGGLISFVLVQAIVGKVRDIESFAIVTLGGLGLPSQLARPIAFAVLVTELAASIAFSAALSVGVAVALGLLRRQLLAERAPVWAKGKTVGMVLPQLVGISSVLLAPARWTDFLPDLTGIVLVLDPIEESCWFIAEELASGVARAPTPLVVLVTAAPRDGERFLRATGLQTDSRVVLTGARSAVLREMGVNWRPAVLVVKHGVVTAAAQLHDAKHLVYLGETTQIGGDAIQPNRSNQVA